MAKNEEPIDTVVAAQTGSGPTFMVAVEQYFPSDQRIIQDDLAFRIMPAGYRFLIKLMRIPLLRNWMVGVSEKQVAGIWSGMMVRKRYIDDKVLEAVCGGFVEAIVNLGAGYDTRVYRLPDLRTVPVWEVDQPVNIDAKRAALQGALGKTPRHVTLVPVNFVEQDLAHELAAHGYTPDHKTFFIWEAVSQYLTEAAVCQTFDFMAQAPAGSRLTFTYVLKDFVEGKNIYGAKSFYERMVVKDQAWHFGFDPADVADFMRGYGWRLIEDLGYDALGERYTKPTGRNLPPMKIERMVYAEKS